MNNFAKRMLAAILTLAMLIPLFCTTLAACVGEPTPPAEPTLESIELDTSGAKLEFAFGETFSADGLKVTAVMSDGTKTDVALSSCRISSPVMTQPGTRVVNVTYQGKSARYNITVKERELPPISKTPVFEITEGGQGTYSVEAEEIDLTVSGVKAAAGKQLIGQTTDPTDGSEIGYLGNYGVEGNYFGFTFTSDKTYENAIIGFHVANPSKTDTFGLGERMNAYLNYKSVAETGDLSLSGLTTLEHLSVSYAEDDTEQVTPIYGEETWWYRILRGVTIPAGTNTLTFDVTATGEVIDIDRIDICVDGLYAHLSSITLDDSKGNEPFIQDFEDFNLANVVTREDFFNANHMKKGQVWLENCVTDAGGRNTSLAAIVAPSEFTTRINLAKDATIEPMFVAASIDQHVHLKDAIDFYIDGNLLTDVEDKDIQDGTPRPDGQPGYWNWKDTSLGLINLTAGSHEFRFVLKGNAGNIDAMKYYVRKWGGFEAELTGITVKEQPTTLIYEAGQLFDPAGLVLEAHYSDNSTTEVTSGYTWAPNGKLTPEDTTVTVSWRGKSADITITVNEPTEDPYDVKIEEDGEFTVEAEDLDMTGNQYQHGKDTFVESVNPAELASDGACLAAFGVAGNKVKVTFRLEKKATVAITAMMAKYEATFDFTGNVNFKLDEELLTNPGEVSFGTAPGNDWYNWKPVELGSYDLEAGYHTLVLEIVGGCPNIDCFKFNVSDYGVTYDAVLDHNGEIVAEAENLDTTEWKMRADQTSFTEPCVGSNNQCAKGYDVGTVFTVNVSLKAKATVKLDVLLASWEGKTFNGSEWTVTFADQTIDMAGKSIPAGQPTGNFHLWETIDLGTYTLEAGRYELKIVVNDGGAAMNIDCFKFTVSEYSGAAEEPEEPEQPTADATVDKDGEIIIEAESLDTSEWKMRNDQTSFTESCNASGGSCAKAHDIGSVITVKISLKDKATVKLDMVVASYEGKTFGEGDWTVTFADKTIDMNEKSVEAGNPDFFAWRTVELGSFELEAGDYELKIVINTQNGTSLNFDCFKLTVSGYGA